MLRGAIIGVGNAALTGHLPAFLDDPWLSARVKLIAAADRSDANRRAIAERVPGIALFDSGEQLVRSAEADFIDLCTPPDARLGLIAAAAERGIHVLCEKPLAADLARGLEIASTLAGRPVVFQPCHQYRDSPLWRKLFEIAGAGEIGDVRLARFDVLRPRADQGNPHGHALWRRDPRVAGGGVVFDIGTHYFYLLRSLFGRPERVHARVKRLTHRPEEVEDTALVVLEFPAALVQLNLSWAADRRENGLRLIGAKGRLELRGERLVMEREGAAPVEWDFAGALSKSAYPRWYAALFRRFVEDVERGRHSREPLAEALDGLRLADLVYRSGESGEALRFAQP